MERNCRKAERSGTRVVPVSPEECFDLLSEVKRAKGYAFSFVRERLKDQVEMFPDVFRCLGVRQENGELLAGLIEAVLGNTALLLAGDQTEDGKRVSAVDFLLFHQVSTHFAGKIEMVDLVGTVTIQGVPNWGLVRHKENFGGTVSLRNTYGKALNPQEV